MQYHTITRHQADANPQFRSRGNQDSVERPSDTHFEVFLSAKADVAAHCVFGYIEDREGSGLILAISEYGGNLGQIAACNKELRTRNTGE